MKLRILFAFILAVAISGCATMPRSEHYVIHEERPAVELKEDAGTVVFFRENNFIGAAVSYYVNDDTEKIGLLRKGSYFIYYATPGLHTFWSETEAKDVISLNVEAKKNYFVIGDVDMGMWCGRPDLEQASEDMFLKVQDELKFTTLSEKGKAHE
ncbi:hypothetical protein [Desulfovibrio ferrophilus]|uniref:DUF2846 domain-containing protein n=1 Tax=Desulfovibrio ferrophilus TaxID=241368 RepID=A0A2Z6B2D9_9BACT|nr:hypothetical protein [Desulfovibrio ferrophilus]BBD09672.1 uncharacterized protein DFE_2946 [Desulfovibrio ferrophilus]